MGHQYAIRLVAAWALVIGLNVFTSGCGDDAAAGAAEALCTRDAALIAQKRDCRADDDCPCGTSCTLGQCLAACAKDADCPSGGHCDRFGQCRAHGDDTLLPGLTPNASSAEPVSMAVPVVRLPAAMMAQPLTLVVPDTGAGHVRVEADTGVEIQCDDGGAFGSECAFESMPHGNKTLHVRVTALLGPGQSRLIRVFTGDEVRSVSISTDPIGGQAPTQDRLQEGEYIGSVTLGSMTTSNDATATGTATNDIRIAVHARVFLSGTGAGIVQLFDDARILAPTGEWDGAMTLATANTGSVDFPTISYVTGTAAAGAPVEVLLDAPPAPFSGGGSSFGFSLTTRFQGVLLGDRTPQSTWIVALSRTGDLPSDAHSPRVSADATATLSVSRGLDPTPWESVVARTATPNPDSVFAMTAADKRALLGTWGRHAAGATLEACNMPTRVVDALAQFALSDSFGVTPASGTTLVAPTMLTSSGLPIVSRLASTFVLADSAAVSATLRTTLPPRSMPCAAHFAPTTSPAFSPAACGISTVSFNLGDIDLCDAMAAAYGCEVVDTAPAGSTLTVDARVSFHQATAACTETLDSAPIVGEVRRVCRMPIVASACADMALCYEAPGTGGTTRDSVRAPLLGTAVLPVSGDLRCATGTRTAAFDLDLNAELATTDPMRLSASAAIAACETDFGHLLADAPPTHVADFADGLTTLFDGGACLDTVRFIYALGLASDGDRRHALDPAGARVKVSSAMTNRLVQRWLAAHAFEAREAAEAERMAQVFRSSPMPGDPVLPEPDAVLAHSLAGWDLLLHPRFATALDQLPDNVLGAIDYRPLVTGAAVTSQPHHDQVTAVPVAIMETLAAQLALLEPRLEEASLNRDLTALRQLAKVLQYANVVRPIAADLAARAKAAATAGAMPVWMARYDAAVRGVAGSLGRLLAAANAIQTGANALGIEENDTPLYFLGDEMSATARFSAISDFLVGPGPSATSAWAPELVQRATDALGAARTAFIGRRDRQVQLAQSMSELEGRLDDIRTRYGEQLGEICGSPPSLSTVQLIEGWSTFNEKNCFVRVEDPVCMVDADQYAALMRIDQVEYQMCLVREVRQRVGQSVGFGNPVLNQIADHWTDCMSPRYPVDCPTGGHQCIECRTRTGALLARAIPDTFRTVAGVEGTPVRVIEDAQNACATAYPDADTSLPRPDALPSHPRSLPECYSGSLGEAFLALRSANQDVDIARSELQDHSDAYDIAMRSCLIQQVGHDKLEAAQAAHDETMSGLRAGKLAADISAHVAEGVQSCGDSLDVVDDALTGGAKSAIVCGAAVVKAAAESVSDGLQFAMDEAQQKHDALMTMIQDDIDDQTCFNDAEMELVGSRTASLQIIRAISDVDSANYQIQELRASARGVMDDGQAALAAARGRSVPPLTHDLWLDESIDTFVREMRLARRTVYLSVRAVEYETQQSLSLRDEVLRATRPEQLRAVLEELWTTAAPRGIGGRRPTDLKVIVSLRKQLLQLADQSHLPATEQNLSDVNRFRMLLASPRYSVFDAMGHYQGQRIPFRIAPLGAIHLGDAQGVPVLAAEDCAERLWSVNASILGSAHMYRGDAPTFARIDLLKSNTFFSQWCSAPAAGPAFQVASVRPSRNLFRDPSFGAEVGMTFGVTNEETSETRARIEAYFNVDRATFESDMYANGDTSELAARGMYGDYALFLPAQTLSVAATAGPTNGLDLNQVDDILLRLDYVSVAR